MGVNVRPATIGIDASELSGDDRPESATLGVEPRSVYAPKRWSVSSLVLTAIVQAVPLVFALWVWNPGLVEIMPAPELSVFDVADPAEPAVEPEPVEEVEPKPVDPAPAEAVETPAEPTPVTPAAQDAPPPPIVRMPAPAVAARAAATPPPPPQPPRASPSAAQSADWHARVLGQLNAVKAYPASARARRQQGVALLRLVLDRTGRVLSVALVESSGFALLDREAVAIPRRATIPAPPDDITGQQIELVVPVEFHF